MTTVVLSNIPDLTGSVSVPRLVAIEHPFGQTMGKPGDADGQRAVLLEALQAAEEMHIPGCVKHLPFECAEGLTHPAEQPPIVKYLTRHPWELPRLISRDVPRKS